MADFSSYAVTGARVATDIHTLYLEAKRFQTIYNAVLSPAISALADEDAVFGTNMTKTQFVSAANTINQLVAFVEAGNPAAGDYRPTIAVLEAWYNGNVR